jgi:acetyl esterase/lipase
MTDKVDIDCSGDMSERSAIARRLVQATAALPHWTQIGAPAARDMRAKGSGILPPPACSEFARWMTIAGPDGPLRLRVVALDNPVGIYLHIHGGGWVLGAADHQDKMLEQFARETGVACVSVDYRLAPERPYPAAIEDCVATALWLEANGEAAFGCAGLSIGGESAGAHLAVCTLLRLRAMGRSPFCAANLVSGFFDLSLSTSAELFGEDKPVLRTSDCRAFVDAFLPETVSATNPEVSPAHAELSGLPPALFSVGSMDALLDDTLLLASRWKEAGNHADLVLYPGAVHGFTTMESDVARRGLRRMTEFLAEAHARRRDRGALRDGA